MTGKPMLAAGLAALASLAVHGALLARILPDAGGTATPPGVAEVSMLGQSFEDLVAGPVAAIAPQAQSIRAVRPTPARTVPTALRLRGAGPTAPAATAESATPVATPPAAATTATVPLTERITAQDAPAAQNPTDATPRPQARPPRPQPSPPPPQRQGNADRTATAGASTGRTDGTVSRPQGDPEAAPGASARDIARYPQQVNRHLSRLRRPDSRFDGNALVGFSIAPSGGLAAIGIIRSSGNADFDDLALRHVRRAAPFPAPPSGAQTQFSVTVRGR